MSKVQFFEETRTRYTRCGDIAEVRVIEVPAGADPPPGAKPCEGPACDWKEVRFR